MRYGSEFRCPNAYTGGRWPAASARKGPGGRLPRASATQGLGISPTSTCTCGGAALAARTGPWRSRLAARITVLSSRIKTRMAWRRRATPGGPRDHPEHGVTPWRDTW